MKAWTMTSVYVCPWRVWWRSFYAEERNGQIWCLYQFALRKEDVQTAPQWCSNFKINFIWTPVSGEQAYGFQVYNSWNTQTPLDVWSDDGLEM
jgi:hypothetical protein